MEFDETKINMDKIIAAINGTGHKVEELKGTYTHQLSPFYHSWVDKTKYFCGDDLTKRLTEITGTL